MLIESGWGIAIVAFINILNQVLFLVLYFHFYSSHLLEH